MGFSPRVLKGRPELRSDAPDWPLACRPRRRWLVAAPWGLAWLLSVGFGRLYMSRQVMSGTAYGSVVSATRAVCVLGSGEA